MASVCVSTIQTEFDCLDRLQVSDDYTSWPKDYITFSTPDFPATQENALALVKGGIQTLTTQCDPPTPGLLKDASGPVSRSRSSTLNIPGLTTSKASPDGSSSPIDMGAKLVIVMVGLPARGKSYLVKKIARYLNWCQYNTEIFNVGDSRRTFAASNRVGEQNADFFDPNNDQASQTREQLALGTLDDLLDYILHRDGCVGIFDATNSVLKRRKSVMDRIRERAGPDVGVLFLESQCEDQSLIEFNIRLKLSGPDYKDQDPSSSLADFKKRISLYERSYVPLGEFEECNNMPYVQFINVGRKIVSHQINNFLSSQTVSYLHNLNLASRQIWITRHGESVDNANGRIGGDSDITTHGTDYARALTRFITHQKTHLDQRPEYKDHDFCVWTSMLKRGIQTAQFFDDDEFEVKHWRLLNELNPGSLEGMTYEQIKQWHKDEHDRRERDKLHYRYPGASGESYLDLISHLRAVICEIERLKEHILVIGHRSVARVLLAYFTGMDRKCVANLNVPLGMLYMLEPNHAGVAFKAFQYNEADHWFEEVPDYVLHEKRLTQFK